MPYVIDDQESLEAGLPAGRPADAFAHPPSHVAAIGVEPGMIVADFGAGGGAHVFPLAEAVGAMGRVYAIDVQRDLLTRIKNEANRRKHHHVDVLWGDLETPQGSKLADDAADMVLISNLLFQLEDKRAALLEARRILKQSGKLAIIDWGTPSSRLSDESNVLRAGISPAGPHRHYTVSQDEVLHLALRSGFEPIGEFDAGTHHYGVLFRLINDVIPSAS